MGTRLGLPELGPIELVMLFGSLALVAIVTEVDPLGRTTGTGFLVGNAAAPLS